MKIWQAVFVLTASAVASGCATVADLPEVGSQFRDYPAEERWDTQPLSLPPEPEQRYVAQMDEAGFTQLEQFVETAYANERLFEQALVYIRALERERKHLVAAGVDGERLAETYQTMYINEAQSCQWVRVGAYGVAGLSFIFLGAAAL